MILATGTLNSLTSALNGAIDELLSPVAHATGTLASATTRLNELLVWATSSLSPADGTLSGNTATYNAFATPYIESLAGLEQWLPVSRRGGGEYNTQNFTVPSGVDNVRVKLDVDPDDFTTSDLSVTIDVEISTDGAQTWIHQMRAGWVGGVQNPPPGHPVGWFASVNGISIFAGSLARVHFSTSGTFRWGLLGEMT